MWQAVLCEGPVRSSRHLLEVRGRGYVSLCLSQIIAISSACACKTNALLLYVER